MKYRDAKQLLQHRLVSEGASWEGISAEALHKTLNHIATELREQGYFVPPDAVDWANRHILHDIQVFGPLHPLLHDGEVTEIHVNGPNRIFVERNGRRERVNIAFPNVGQLRRTVEAILELEPGKRLDGSMPYVDLAGPDGCRINLAIPPVVVGGPHVTIRKFHGGIKELADLVALGSLDERLAVFLDACVRSRLNILFSGASGSGKTTLLEQLGRHIPADERIVVIEDTLELEFDQPNVVRLLTRNANIEGRGEISIRDLLRNALRMSPSRILLGELRGAEALEYLQALSSGHRGSLAILHAASPEEAMVRLENLARYSGLDVPASTLRRQIAYGLDVVVQLEQLPDGTRKVMRVAEVLSGDSENGVEVRDLFRFEAGEMVDGLVSGSFVATNDLEAFHRHFQRYGLERKPAPKAQGGGQPRTLTEVIAE